MKKCIPLVLLFGLLTIVFISGCSGVSSFSNPDKKFYETAYNGPPQMSATIREMNNDPMDPQKRIYYESLLLQQTTDFIPELVAMPVSEKMVSIKQDFIQMYTYETYQDQYNIYLLSTSPEKFFESTNYKNEDAYAIRNINWTIATEKFNRAIKSYEALYPEEIATHTNSHPASEKQGYVICISYPYSWSGNYGDADSQKSINGQNGKDIKIDHIDGSLVVIVQKTGGNSETLKVEILKDGDVMKSETTDSPYGAVSITYTPGWLD